ncbi:DUF695 domain-containing protein [Sphingobacterium corticibacterium]|uniref:DUF695 domain-containing protein n=1 Tax=Sphingobacterium corticibacterium TaxID=2484746 RepID=A0A4Q6XY39_9SPHI|nr:DUF695 domain-containing protein [Sphingobacterium corticibacterium]RZF61456.1 DUF695 domain-containing protein [Sphingobacterium corticibacterium]
MKKIMMWTFLLAIFGCCNANLESTKISLEEIEEMFSNMEANGVYTDTTLLWGYFFTSNKKDDFEKVANELKNKGFEFVDIFQADDKSYWLHLERKEIHNAKSLYELDEELYEIAGKYKITYDGFDVGNVDEDRPLERDTYVVPEEFKTVDHQKDSFPCLLIGNTAFDRFPHKEEFCYFIKVTTPYNMDEESMLPVQGELDELDKFELFFENNLTQKNIKNYYVFRDTHKGIRNFYIVTNDKVGAKEVIDNLSQSGEQRPFEFEISTDKEWSLYNAFREKI